MNRIKSILTGLIVAIVAVALLWEAFKWTAMRVFVGPDQALVVTNKFGRPLPADLIVVPHDQNEYKGVEQDVRGPGRYFLNPVEYEWQTVPLIDIPAGEPQNWEWTDEGALKDPETAPKIGLVSLKQGKSPAEGSEVVGPDEKGIQREVLTPGTYKINPFVEEVTVMPAVVVPPGSVGVVTRLIGDIGEISSATLTQIRASTTGPSTQPGQHPDPTAPTRLVVGRGISRGILKDVLQPGIYYLHPMRA